MKILKSKKALSPVVASIILIAVTVAVSIAVAAWMGALTFTFTQTEELAITAMTFPTSSSIKLTVKNTGTSSVTVSTVYVNDVAINSTNISFTGSFSSSGTLNAGDTGYITISSYSWTAGNKYRVVLQSSSGKNVASYEKTASSSS